MVRVLIAVGDEIHIPDAAFWADTPTFSQYSIKRSGLVDGTFLRCPTGRFSVVRRRFLCYNQNRNHVIGREQT